MADVKCPRCNSLGEIRTASGVMTQCYVCGGAGYVPEEDYQFLSKWKKQQTEAVAAKKPAARAARPRATTKTKTAGSTPAVDPLGRSPLHLAASDGYIKAVQELLEAGVDVNARDSEGRTPLFWPAFRGHLEIVRALIDAGADVNATDNNGRTPLVMATAGKHEGVIALLREQGAA